jgi:hypothetical protein
MKIIRLILTVVCAGFSTGCAHHHYQAAVGRSAATLPDKAYLYGRFKVERGFMLATQLSLQLTNTSSGDNLGLRLKSSDDVYAVAVTPGEYQIAHVILAKAGPNLEFVGDYKRIPFRFNAEHQELGLPFKAQAGSAYYVGDYFGVTTRTGVSPTYGGFVVGFGGDVTEVRFNYDETTRELKRLLPQFEGIRTKPAWKVK